MLREVCGLPAPIQTKYQINYQLLLSPKTIPANNNENRKESLLMPTNREFATYGRSKPWDAFRDII